MLLLKIKKYFFNKNHIKDLDFQDEWSFENGNFSKDYRSDFNSKKMNMNGEFDVFGSTTLYSLKRFLQIGMLRNSRIGSIILDKVRAITRK